MNYLPQDSVVCLYWVNYFYTIIVSYMNVINKVKQRK